MSLVKGNWWKYGKFQVSSSTTYQKRTNLENRKRTQGYKTANLQRQGEKNPSPILGLRFSSASTKVGALGGGGGQRPLPETGESTSGHRTLCGNKRGLTDRPQTPTSINPQLLRRSYNFRRTAAVGRGGGDRKSGKAPPRPSQRLHQRLPSRFSGMIHRLSRGLGTRNTRWDGLDRLATLRPRGRREGA